MRAGGKLYLQQNVLDAAKERIAKLFDAYEHITVSISGGKDSTVLLDLCRQEAIRRGRMVGAFFLDQEAEYQASIDQVRCLMTQEAVIPYWFQVPIRMTNAASLAVDFLYAWGPGEAWMREKDPMAIHAIDAAYPQRFYKFFPWFEKTYWAKGTACAVVGLRAEESINRFRAMVKYPGRPDMPWSTAGHTLKAYPLYDWTFEDVWHYIAERKLPYNRVYDFMHQKGHRIQNVRVSYLGHEHSFKCLADLHEFEPETYRKLLDRMPGVHVAARYANEPTIFHARTRPPAFTSWRVYRDFLLETSPSAHLDRFRKRFALQGDTEDICRQQCQQLLINDWEASLTVTKTKAPHADKLAKWREVL